MGSDMEIAVLRELLKRELAMGSDRYWQHSHDRDYTSEEARRRTLGAARNNTRGIGQ
jgi:hypothetical protein